MLNTIKTAVGVVAFAASTALMAFPVDLTSVSGTFSNAVGGQNVQGQGSNYITWGNSNRSKASGYQFEGYSNLPLTITDADPFLLGTFTHFNKPIEGNAISGVNLNINLGFSGFGDSENVTGTFTFSHNETPNNATYGCFLGFLFCQHDGAVDDIVTLITPAVSSDFQLGDYVYNLVITGFNNLTSFASPEGGQTSVGLFAYLDSRYAGETTTVPEPSTLALLGLGLLGLGFARRRVKAA